MIKGYINIGMFQLNNPYAIIKSDNSVKNGTVKIDDIAMFCKDNELDTLYLYGPKNYTNKIKQKIDLNLTEYNYNKCDIILEEE